MFGTGYRALQCCPLSILGGHKENIFYFKQIDFKIDMVYAVLQSYRLSIRGRNGEMLHKNEFYD